MYDSSTDAQTTISSAGQIGSALTSLLMAEDIDPGSPPAYELCKTIHAYHPLGAVLADAPITLAQSKAREIAIGVLGEARLIARFQDVWDSIGKIGATVILHNQLKTSRIYGIASIAVGEVGKDPATPLDLTKIAEADLFFNVLDPLNTAGSLVLNQDPNSPEFLKPSGGAMTIAGVKWHPSRLNVKMNEQPLYIEWSPSAFGFVGRSVYQRALYPLRTFVQSMITDQMVTQKAGLLVAKMATPGSFIDNVMQSMFGWKRSKIKAGATGQVLSIGIDEEIETLNMQNLDKAAEFARHNCIKNIATAAGMPASIIAQETLTEGFGEGTEDAKKEARYLDYIRQDAKAQYDFMDRIVMRKAWTEEFYESLKVDYPEYRKIPFETALLDWIRAFSARWPNLLEEPDSEKSKTADVQFKAVVALLETLGPMLDPENKAKIVAWAAENANERPELFAAKLDIDEDKLREHLEAEGERMLEMGQGAEGEREPTEPRPFSNVA